MIVVFAGLPGTGKSTIASALALRLQGYTLLLDKDPIRDTLFGPAQVEYSQAQDDFCMEVIFRTAQWFITRHPGRTTIILDGRTFLRQYQLDQVLAFAADSNQLIRIIECVCNEQTVQNRLLTASSGVHPAKNRTFDLYLRLRRDADPLDFAHLIIDTATNTPRQATDICLQHLATLIG